MLQQDIRVVQEGAFTVTLSDQNKKILQIETGNLYDQAWDIVPCPYTYQETDINITDEESWEEEQP